MVFLNYITSIKRVHSFITIITVITKGAITSKIKHAIKHKTSPARLAQLLQPSLAFCFSLQPMTAWMSLAASQNKMLMRAATVVQQLCKSCRTCFKFYCTFYSKCDHSLSKNMFSDVVVARGLYKIRLLDTRTGKNVNVITFYSVLTKNSDYLDRSTQPSTLHGTLK